MQSKKISCFITLLLLFGIINGNAQKMVTGFEAPESIVKYDDRLFVSNIGGAQFNPMALDSNGFISMLTLNGKILKKRFQKTILNGPKGLAIADNILFVADINRVAGYDVNSGEQVFELDILGSGLLNDLCAIDKNTIVVTDSNTGNVYKINISGKEYFYLGNIAGANGVTYDSATKKLYVCGMGKQMDGNGKLYVKDFVSNDTLFTSLANTPIGIFDGLEMIDGDHLLVTDWVSFTGTNKKARLVEYDLREHTNKVYNVAPGPADLHYDKLLHIIYLPQLLSNTVLIENINKLKEE